MKQFQKPIVAGVDPGIHGALAFFNTVTGDLEVYETPLLPLLPGTNVKTKRYVDLRATARLVELYAADTAFAVVEKVGAMPENGVVSMFRFGYVTGAVTGVLAGQFIPLHETMPAVWKAQMGLTHDKKLSIAMAKRKFPKHAHLFERKVRNGRLPDGQAEAAMLALFGVLKILPYLQRKEKYGL